MSTIRLLTLTGSHRVVMAWSAVKAFVLRGALTLAALVVGTGPALSQDTFGFRDFDWYDPLVAEQRAARMLVTFGGTDAFEFSLEDGRRLVWDIHLGKELPMISFVKAVNPGALRAGEWGIGLWAPVSVHMIEDFKDPSNPIVNADYRFGSMIKFRYALAPERWLSARFVPWAHESTHLGDEFSLAAAEHFPGFERINVSYEYWEYGIGLESPRWSLRHGGLQPWGKDGYYSDHLLQVGGRTIPTSAVNFEPSFGVEYRSRHSDGRTWAPFASLETRGRIAYDYNKPSSSDPERRHWSTSVSAGIKTSPAPASSSSLSLSHIYVHFYRGVNPHGQLRNDASYSMLGVGFQFRVK